MVALSSPYAKVITTKEIIGSNNPTAIFSDWIKFIILLILCQQNERRQICYQRVDLLMPPIQFQSLI
jgi:hypothetical protein